MKSPWVLTHGDLLDFQDSFSLAENHFVASFQGVDFARQQFRQKLEGERIWSTV